VVFVLSVQRRADRGDVGLHARARDAGETITNRQRAELFVLLTRREHEAGADEGTDASPAGGGAKEARRHGGVPTLRRAPTSGQKSGPGAFANLRAPASERVRSDFCDILA